jgi:hypothetical protein
VLPLIQPTNVVQIPQPELAASWQP